MFLVSGEIPRVTEYETGVKNGIRFEKSTGKWEKDESIIDERFLMCNLKGTCLALVSPPRYSSIYASFGLHAEFEL
jgi:7,8-dihydropterin-6-yl-methyl-4-(beta-D-ribofuranosyl)aminobenzene 5'-phosphate synthase